MLFSITPLYAIPISIIYLLLWFRTTVARGTFCVSIGHSNNEELLLRIRQHGNCAEWSSFILIIMMLGEGTGIPAVYLHIGGMLLLAGRVFHPFGLKVDNGMHPLRIIGNSLNLIAVFACLIGITLEIITL